VARRTATFFWSVFSGCAAECGSGAILKVPRLKKKSAKEPKRQRKRRTPKTVWAGKLLRK